jgi:hypothetical protein
MNGRAAYAPLLISPAFIFSSVAVYLALKAGARTLGTLLSLAQRVLTHG